MSTNFYSKNEKHHIGKRTGQSVCTECRRRIYEGMICPSCKINTKVVLAFIWDLNPLKLMKMIKKKKEFKDEYGTIFSASQMYRILRECEIHDFGYLRNPRWRNFS